MADILCASRRTTPYPCHHVGRGYILEAVMDALSGYDVAERWIGDADVSLVADLVLLGTIVMVVGGVRCADGAV